MHPSTCMYGCLYWILVQSNSHLTGIIPSSMSPRYAPSPNVTTPLSVSVNPSAMSGPPQPPPPLPPQQQQQAPQQAVQQQQTLQQQQQALQQQQQQQAMQQQQQPVPPGSQQQQMTPQKEEPLQPPNSLNTISPSYALEHLMGLIGKWGKKKINNQHSVRK